MRRFQIFRYLKKFLLLIVAFFIIMTVLACRVIESRQQYMASAVIEYCNEDAAKGLAPDGSNIDITEINSSSNMAKVIANLGLSSYSLDSLCASVKVIPVEALEEEEEKKEEESAEEEKEEEHPTAYIVSCTLGSTASKELARDILNELLDVYFADYSKKHINLEQANNKTKDLVNTDYDYLEMVENLDAQLEETISVLNSRHNMAPNFRSADTGYSFADLRDQFQFLDRVNLSKLYSLILGNQITKDKQLLLNKYENRIANHGLTGTKAQEDIDSVQATITAYVDKIVQSGNDNIDYNYILHDVHEERWSSGQLVDRTVEYDQLLRSWIKYRDAQDHAVLDTAYCQYIIGVYRDGKTQLTTEGSDGTSEETGLEFYAPTSQHTVTNEQVEAEIRSAIEEMNELYSIVERTNLEYNDYMGAANIRVLSSTSAGEAFNMQLYIVIIAVFFLLVGCGGAILLGRVGDILEYSFLKDHLTGCMNRLACDKYIQRRENEVVSTDTCCLSIQITNQRQMNRANGRTEVDQAMKEFGRILREIFENGKNDFVGYNGSGQFWVFFEKTSHGTLKQEIDRLVAALSHTLSKLPFQYQMGAVNAGDASVFQLRGLISKAVKERKLYLTAGPPGLSAHDEEAPAPDAQKEGTAAQEDTPEKAGQEEQP